MYNLLLDNGNQNAATSCDRASSCVQTSDSQTKHDAAYGAGVRARTAKVTVGELKPTDTVPTVR